ncbi:MAG TPA: hypothetical protein VGE97_06635 [Nitrososphaera sp.]|jgi:hypothetical protein
MPKTLWFFAEGEWHQIPLLDAGSITLSDVLVVGNDAGANTITNLADPTLAQDAATKAYVDSVTPPAPDLTSVLTVDNDAGGLGISNLLDPVSAQDAATKNYVDTAIIDGGGP